MKVSDSGFLNVKSITYLYSSWLIIIKSTTTGIVMDIEMKNKTCYFP